MHLISDDIQSYVEKHTQSEPELLKQLSQETYETMSAPQMLTGRIEGRFLKLLVQISGAKRILEIGMFTGYSALSMAEALPDDGQLITCDVDPRAEAFAQRYFDQSPHGHKIKIKMGPALETIESIVDIIDLVFIDADKKNYGHYYEAVLPKLPSGGLIVVDNTLWSGRVVYPEDEQTQAIADLNQMIVEDERVENVLLSVRDGINLVRKK